MRTWGIHTISNVFRCNPLAIRDAGTIYNFNKALVKKIDMKSYGPPQIVHFGTGNKAGFTLVQLIETSNICAHFVEETNDFYLDVFSCKEFKQDAVESVIRDFFQPTAIQSYTFERQAQRPVPHHFESPHRIELPQLS